MRGNISGKSIIGWSFTFVLLFAALGLLATRKNVNAQSGGQSAKITLTSPAFSDGQLIPARYTCDGQDISPPLKWSGVPAGTRSLALICQDPDAPHGTFTHWAYYGLPATLTELPEGIPPVETPPVGGRQVVNSFHKIGYGGPCPPSGKVHHYIFTVFALDSNIPLQSKTTGSEFLSAVQPHIIGQGDFTGIYKKK